jgi:hypothetical protein
VAAGGGDDLIDEVGDDITQVERGTVRQGALDAVELQHLLLGDLDLRQVDGLDDRGPQAGVGVHLVGDHLG